MWSLKHVLGTPEWSHIMPGCSLTLGGWFLEKSFFFYEKKCQKFRFFHDFPISMALPPSYPPPQCRDPDFPSPRGARPSNSCISELRRSCGINRSINLSQKHARQWFRTSRALPKTAKWSFGSIAYFSPNCPRTLGIWDPPGNMLCSVTTWMPRPRPPTPPTTTGKSPSASLGLHHRRVNRREQRQPGPL